MNDHSRWRLELAHDINARLLHFAGIRAVVVGGSVARGFSDALSDLEILLFWDDAPRADVRREIATELRAKFRYPEADPGYESAFLIRGVPVDIWHLTVAGEEAAMAVVLREHSIDLDESNVLDTVRAGIPLRGHDLVRGWKDRVRAYPDELAICFLQAYLPHFHLRQLNLAARRDNPTAYYHTLSDIQCSLFLILLAMNRSYFPTYKWMYQTLDRLPVDPPQLVPRLRQMFHAPPSQAAAQLRDVLAETLVIAEARFPDLDPKHAVWARYGLEQVTRVYEAAMRDVT